MGNEDIPNGYHIYETLDGTELRRNEIVIVTSGRFKGETFKIVGRIEDVLGTNCLPTLASRGNPAAINALDIDNYKYDDEPFYYGKIGALGYIISHKDLPPFLAQRKNDEKVS